MLSAIWRYAEWSSFCRSRYNLSVRSAENGPSREGGWERHTIPSNWRDLPVQLSFCPENLFGTAIDAKWKQLLARRSRARRTICRASSAPIFARGSHSCHLTGAMSLVKFRTFERESAFCVSVVPACLNNVMYLAIPPGHTLQNYRTIRRKRNKAFVSWSDHFRFLETWVGQAVDRDCFKVNFSILLAAPVLLSSGLIISIQKIMK